jgi:uncharacterized protein YkuJ
MKKFFTLIACALVAGSAFAQKDWTPVEGKDGYVQKDFITNGSIAWNILMYDEDAGAVDFSKYPTGQMNNFKANDYPGGDDPDVAKVNVGQARVVVDPSHARLFATGEELEDFNELNYCIEVGSHSNPSNPWDAQFFITVGEDNAFQEGDQVTLKMKVKAEIGSTPAVEGVKWTQEEIDAAEEGDPAFGKTTDDYKVEPIAAVNVKASSQTHNNPGGYLNNNGPGDVNFTTDWVEIEKTFTENGGYTIAFNLNEFKTANKYYFDDISIVVVREEAPTADEEMYDKTIPEGFEEITVNGDFEGEGIENYIVHDWIDGVKNEFADPRIIADPANPENKCIVITTPANPANAWAAQFFITDPKHHFYKGDIVRLRMRVKADEKQSAEAQTHAGPGSYISSNFANATFKKDFWFNFDSGEKEVTDSNLGKGTALFQTIAFNLSTLKTGNNVYFDDIQLIVKRADPLAAAKSDLEAAIAKGKGASKFQKTDASLYALDEAVTIGELTLDDADATKADLEAAVADIDDAFAALAYVDGYTPLSADMYMDYTDAENPVATKCMYKIYESVDVTYGDGQFPATKYADVSDFDELILVCGDNTAPRIIINADKGEEAIDITVGSETPSPYLITLDDPQYGYVIDLAAIVAEQGYAHLNAIRKPGNDAGITAVDMVLGKGTATSISEAKVAKAAKAIFNVAGQQIKSLQKGLNIVDGKKIFVK